MIRNRAVRTLGAVSFAAFVSVAAPSGAQSKGYTFEMVTKTTSSSPMAGAGSGMTATGIAGPDGSMRMEITALEGTATISAVGDYYIFKEGKMLLVRPQTKTYIDIGEQALSAMSNLPPQMLAQMQITGVTATSENVAGNEQVNGFPTEHRRTTVSYSMGIAGQTIPTTIVTDYWLAKLNIPMINPMAGIKNALTSGPFAELVTKQLEVTPPAGSGLAVKAIITQTVSAMGQQIVSTTTSEMRNFREGAVDASKIVMPEGYTKATR
ncbi:MAG: hypothetical protein ACO1Q7_18215 [Gemmatimonas sp.]